MPPLPPGVDPRARRREGTTISAAAGRGVKQNASECHSWNHGFQKRRTTGRFPWKTALHQWHSNSRTHLISVHVT